MKSGALMKPDIDLNLFLNAQEEMYFTALTEIELGMKRSHWMWYIFPQHIKLGSSVNAQRYGIVSLEHAEAYLAHEVLGARLREMVEATLTHRRKPARLLFDGGVDALKFQSSLTLFLKAASADADRALFSEVLEAFYSGEQCELTLRHLRA